MACHPATRNAKPAQTWHAHHRTTTSAACIGIASARVQHASETLAAAAAAAAASAASAATAASLVPNTTNGRFVAERMARTMQLNGQRAFVVGRNGAQADVVLAHAEPYIVSTDEHQARHEWRMLHANE